MRSIKEQIEKENENKRGILKIFYVGEELRGFMGTL